VIRTAEIAAKARANVDAMRKARRVWHFGALQQELFAKVGDGMKG
jgi:hypothetical protein